MLSVQAALTGIPSMSGSNSFDLLPGDGKSKIQVAADPVSSGCPLPGVQKALLSVHILSFMHFDQCVHPCSQQPKPHVGHFHHLESSLTPFWSIASPTGSKPWFARCWLYSSSPDRKRGYRAGLWYPGWNRDAPTKESQPLLTFCALSTSLAPPCLIGVPVPKTLEWFTHTQEVTWPGPWLAKSNSHTWGFAEH